MTVQLRHRLEYGALRGAMFAADLLPEVVAYSIAAAIGRVFFRCSRRRQRAALRMLRNAYPDRHDAELLALARRATGNIFKVSLDMLRLGKFLALDRLRERVESAAFERALIPPPFLGLTGHFGSWEVGAVSMAALTGGADVVVQTFDNPLIQGFLERSRGHSGLTLHPRRGGLRGLARGLEARRVGMQAVDQNQRLRGVAAPFFGEIASCERAAATLAVRMGYPILFGGAIRTGIGFRFELFLSEPFYAVQTGDRERDIEATVREINRRLEELVLRYSEQYLWIHDRYKTRPEPAEEPAKSP